ncbi:hypothetical protein [Paenibacillus periandrae]|uniref:hypothetical protein n=1 Tax=Paenibacillus periandrae TaxID=1761741 RepID=UPI001F095390|nr:hypothetical protein [Paenibacillus periandrae]
MLKSKGKYYPMTGMNNESNLGNGIPYIHLNNNYILLEPFLQWIDRGLYLFDSYYNHKAMAFLINYPTGDKIKQKPTHISDIYQSLKKKHLAEHTQSSAEDVIYLRSQATIVQQITDSKDLLEFHELTKQLEQVICNHDRGIMLLQMEDGMGKTTFAKMLDPLVYGLIKIPDVNCRVYYVHDVFSYMPSTFVLKITDLLRQIDENMLDGELPTVDIHTPTVKQQVAHLINVLCKERTKYQHKGKALLIIDGVDEIPHHGGVTIFDLIPSSDMLDRGIYILLTSRTGEQLTNSKKSQLVGMHFDKTIVIQRTALQYRELLIKFIRSRTKSNAADEDVLLNVSGGKFIFLQILLKAYVEYGLEGVDNLPVMAEQHYLSILQKLYGDQYYNNMLRMLLSIILSPLSLPIKLLSRLCGEEEISFRFLCFLQELRPLVDVQRSGKGNILSFHRAESVGRISDQYQGLKEDLISNWWSELRALSIQSKGRAFEEDDLLYVLTLMNIVIRQDSVLKNKEFLSLLSTIVESLVENAQNSGYLQEQTHQGFYLLFIQMNLAVIEILQLKVSFNADIYMRLMYMLSEDLLHNNILLEAIEHLETGIELIQNHGIKVSALTLSQCYSGLAQLYSRVGNKDKAESYFSLEEQANEKLDKEIIKDIRGKALSFKRKANNKISQAVHYNQEKGETNLKILEKIKEKKVEFVIFQNKERVMIIDSDTTYLNVLAEGTIQLLLQLSAVYGDFDLHILIATRKNTDKGYGIISPVEYENRLRERIILGLARKALTRKNKWKYSITFADARENYNLMIADGICNTYLTRSSTKFDSTQKNKIEQLYDQQYVFSFYESSVDKELQRWLTEGKLGDVIFECFLEHGLENKVNYLSIALKRLKDLDDYGLKLQLLSISSKLETFIKIDRNYEFIRPVLVDMQNSLIPKLKELGLNVPEFNLDIILYLYSLYTHIGSMEAEVQDRLFLQEATTLDDVMTKFRYFNIYKIRRGIHKKNGLHLLQSINDLSKSIDVFEEMIQLLDLLDETSDYQNSSSPQMFEMLGKAYGTRGQGYTMLIHEDQGYLDKAIRDFDNALRHFSFDLDKERQYIYKSLAYCEGRQYELAVDYLYKAFQRDKPFEGFRHLVRNLKEQDVPKVVFKYHCYIQIMAYSKEHGLDKLADQMYEALTDEHLSLESIMKKFTHPHPMQFIFLNMASYLELSGKTKQALKYLDVAIDICESSLSSFTNKIVQLGMYSTKILLLNTNGKQELAEKVMFELRECYQEVKNGPNEKAVTEYLNDIQWNQPLEEKDLRRLVALTRCIN